MMKNRIFIIAASVFIMLYFTAFDKKTESENIIDILLGYVEQDDFVKEDIRTDYSKPVLEVKKTIDFTDNFDPLYLTYTDYQYA